MQPVSSFTKNVHDTICEGLIYSSYMCVINTQDWYDPEIENGHQCRPEISTHTFCWMGSRWLNWNHNFRLCVYDRDFPTWRWSVDWRIPCMGRHRSLIYWYIFHNFIGCNKIIVMFLYNVLMELKSPHPSSLALSYSIVIQFTVASR